MRMKKDFDDVIDSYEEFGPIYNERTYYEIDWDNLLKKNILNLDEFGINNVNSAYNFILKTKKEDNTKLGYAFKSDKIDMGKLSSRLLNSRLNFIRADNIIIMIDNVRILFDVAILSFFGDISIIYSSITSISNITIRYMFGYLKYDIDLNNSITAIQAPNGFGKSTFINIFLKMFDYSAKGIDLNELLNMPFKEITVDFFNDENRKEKISILNDKKNGYVYYKGYRNKVFLDNRDEQLLKTIENFEYCYKIDNNDGFEALTLGPNKFLYLNNFNLDNFNLLDGSAYEKESVELFNKLIGRFYGDEKEIKINLTNIIDDSDFGLIFEIKNNLIVRNKITPLYCNKSILKKDELIPFDKLSSGEKYIIYLLATLLFGTVAGSDGGNDSDFFIIDEPELYLHIEWQQLLIESINKIIEYRHKRGLWCDNVKVLIATHSPYIINSPYVKDGGPEYEEE